MHLLTFFTAALPLASSLSLESDVFRHKTNSTTLTSAKDYCGVAGYPKTSDLFSTLKATDADDCSEICYETSECQSFGFGDTKCLLYSECVFGHFISNKESPYTYYKKDCFLKPSVKSTVKPYQGSTRSDSPATLSISHRSSSTAHPEFTTETAYHNSRTSVESTITTTSTRRITLTETVVIATPTPVSLDDLVIRSNCSGTGSGSYVSKTLNEIGQFVLTNDTTSALRVAVAVNPAVLSLGPRVRQRDLILLNLFNATDLTRLAAIDAFKFENIGWASANIIPIGAALSGTTSRATAQGSIDNSFDRARTDPYRSSLESAIWSLDLSTLNLTGRWINANGSPGHTLVMEINVQITPDKQVRGLYLAGSTAAALEVFGDVRVCALTLEDPVNVGLPSSISSTLSVSSTSSISSSTTISSTHNPSATPIVFDNQIIRVDYIGTNTLTVAGFVSRDLNELGVHRLVSDPDEALSISFTVPAGSSASGLDLVENNLANFTDVNRLAAVPNYYTTDNDLEPGTTDFAWLGASFSTLPGASPQLVDNSFNRGWNVTFLDNPTLKPAESAIWSLDLTTNELIPQWINTDGTIYPSYLVIYNDGPQGFAVTADVQAMGDIFEATFPVRFTLDQLITLDDPVTSAMI